MATLDDTYNQAVNEQRDYLAKLQDAFNKHCEEITAAATQKLAAIPETDLEGRQQAFEEQKKQLADALDQLKKEIDASMTQIRKKLEEIHRQREEITLRELEQLMDKYK